MSNHYLIAVGDIYSYKELCKQLGDKATTGGGKKNQLKHWKTCFQWV
jgi:hypothetical protein